MIAPANTTSLAPSAVDNGRHATTERVLVLIGLLSPLRYGATIDDLLGDLADSGHSVCERTLNRDLALLTRLGLADRVCRGRWLWNGTGRRAAVLASVGQEIAGGLS